MSLRRSMLRKQFRQNQTLDTLEGLGKLPNTKSATMAMAGNTFSGARRRMAQAAKQQAVRLTPEELAIVKGEPAPSDVK